VSNDKWVSIDGGIVILLCHYRVKQRDASWMLEEEIGLIWEAASSLLFRRGKAKDIIIKRSAGVNHFLCFAAKKFLLRGGDFEDARARAPNLFRRACNPAGRFRLTRSRRVWQPPTMGRLVIHRGESKEEMHRN